MAVCYTADEAGAAFDAFVDEEVIGNAEGAAIMLAKQAVYYGTTLRATWANPNDFWTKQFWGSAVVSVGSPNLSALPRIQPEQPWPIALTTYSPSEYLSDLSVLDGFRLGDTIYITNNAEHAATVEAHTGIFSLSAELASRDVASIDWSNVSAARSIPF